MIPPVMTERVSVEHGLVSVFSLAFSPDGTLLAGGGDVSVGTDSHATQGAVILWNPMTGQEVRRFIQSAPVLSVAFSPDGRILATGSDTLGRRAGARNACMLWDVATGREIFAMTSESSPVRSVAFSPDGALLAIAGLVGNHDVALWDVASRTEVQRLTGHTQAVQAVTFNRDGTLLASGSDDETLKVWEVKTGREIVTYGGWRTVQCATFTPDNAMVVAGDAYGVHAWDMATGKEQYELFGPVNHTVYALDFNGDGTLLAGAFGEEYIHLGAVLLWRIAANTWRTLFTGGTGSVIYAVAISPNGQTLASAGDEDLQLWQIR